jgi:hypothetical protein
VFSKDINTPKRAQTTFLVVPKDSKNLVSVTSTKKATIDVNEPGKQASMKKRIHDLDSIKHVKNKSKFKTEEEEEKKLPLEQPISKNIDDVEDKDKNDKNGKGHNYTPYVIGALTLGAVGLFIWKKNTH